MRIENRGIGEASPPYVIAEISCNHNGDLGMAFDLIKQAKWAGADAVKFQCYTPDTITIDCDKEDFVVKAGPWQGQTLYSLYRKAHTPFEWFPKLFHVAREEGITCFASVFDESSVDFLESLRCPAYKIASFEITDHPLIKKVATTNKPVIISTGMADWNEITDAAVSSGWSACMLHCISGYPTPVHEANLAAFVTLNNNYSLAGISDHTLGWNVPLAATALGACMIEKHMTLSRDIPTEDADFSLEPGEFKVMCHHVKEIWQACQESNPVSQESSRQFRRSLYVVENMKAGERFTPQNVRSIRPGYGMDPIDMPKVLMMRAAKDIERGTPLSQDLIR